MSKNLIEIVEKRSGGNSFCKDENIVVTHCYDYYKEYCPKTCVYTLRMKEETKTKTLWNEQTKTDTFI